MSSTEHWCPFCGTPNDKSARFCDHCGVSLTQASAPPRMRPTGALVRIGIAAAAISLAVGLTTQAWYGGRDSPGALGAVGVPTGAKPMAAVATLPRALSATSALLPVGFRIGDVAPDFTLRNTNGREVSLSGFRGQPVIINFWASWCTYCRVEMLELNALYKDESVRHGLVVLAVDTLDSDRLSAESFIINKAFSFTVLWDENNRVANQYDVRALPVSFFVDRSGIIRAYRPGAMPREEMREKAESIY